MGSGIVSRPLLVGGCLVVPRASRLTPTDVYLSLNGQFSPGYAQAYFELQVFASGLLASEANCSSFEAIAEVSTSRFNNVTGEQEVFTLSAEWRDGIYIFSAPVPFARKVEVFVDGITVASLDYSFNSFSRYLDVLYLTLGILGCMILVLVITFQIIRRLSKTYTKKHGEKGPEKNEGDASPSVLSKLPRLSPLSLAPCVNASRRGANKGDTEMFHNELKRQGSINEDHESRDTTAVEADEETVTTRTILVGTALKPHTGLKKRVKLADSIKSIFKGSANTPQDEYSRNMEQRRLRFSRIMRRPPKCLNRDATDKLRGNEAVVKEAELDDAQRQALKEMKLAALVKYEKFVPRSYLAVAVWLEGTVCHTEEFERCFGMDVFDTAKTIHNYLVETVPPSRLKSIGGKGETPKDRSLIRDGFYFATLAIVHIVLVSAFSSGLFISRQMLTSVTTSISLAVAASLLFVLPFMTSMSENSSYYLYQGLYGLVPQVVCRDLSAGLCVCLFPSLLSVVLAGIITEDVVASVFIGLFCFLFGSFMLLYTMMYLFNGPYKDVVLLSGRSTGFVALVLLLLLLPFVVSIVVAPDIAHQTFWISLHVVSILAANIAIILRLRKLSTSWLAWLPDKIRLAYWMKSAADAQQFEERLKSLSTAQRKEALFIVNAKQIDPATWAGYKETEARAFWDYYFIEANALRKRAVGQIENPACIAFDMYSGRMVHAVMLFTLLLLSSIPIFLEEPASSISRSLNYTLLAFILTAGVLEIFVYDVSSALNEDEEKSKIPLMPASPTAILEVENFLHSSILGKYSTGAVKFQATAFFWALCTALIAFIVEPSALALTVPFGLGYDFVVYSMFSRIFFIRNPFALRVDVASVLAVLSALAVTIVLMACIAILPRDSFWVATVITTAAFQIMRFAAVEVVSFDPTSRYSWQPQKPLWRYVVEKRFVLLSALLTTISASIGGLYAGCFMTAAVNSNLFAQFQDGTLVASFVVGKIATSVLVFGTPCESFCERREEVAEAVLQLKGALSVSLVMGIGYVYLSPLSTAAMTGFVSGAVVYCHGLQTLIFKPCNLLHRPLDVVDIPVTSGKRTMAYAEGLSEELLKESELEFTNKLLLSKAGKRLRFEEADKDTELLSPMAFLAADILSAFEKSLAAIGDHDNLPELFSYMFFLLESMYNSLKFEDSIQVYGVDKYTMQREGFFACAVSGTVHLDESEVDGVVQDMSIYVTLDASLWGSSCCFNNLNKVQKQKLRRSPEYNQSVMCLAEAIFHEFVEMQTGSHKFAVIAELLLKSRDSPEPSIYLPENIIRQLLQLSQQKGNDFERVYEESSRHVSSKALPRMPPTWQFSRPDWEELCQLELEYQEEICNFCETLAPQRATRKVKWRSLDWARVYYMGLTGDLEVNKEIRSYLEHYQDRVRFDKFWMLLLVHEWIARPLLEVCIWTFTWTCSPLYRRLRKRKGDPTVSDIHKSVLDVAPPKMRWTLELRPVLFESLEAKDQGQTFIPGALCTMVDEIVLRRCSSLQDYWKERHMLTLRHIDSFSSTVQENVKRELGVQSKQMQKLRSCHNASDLLTMGAAGSSILTEHAPDPAKLDAVIDSSGTVFYVSGGVTTCLMQLLNCEEAGETFNFHVLCEVASASTSRIAVTQDCVSSVYTVPLHELSRCPEKFIHTSASYLKLSLRKHRTTPNVLKTKFFPLLSRLITVVSDVRGDEEAVDVFVQLYEYFEEYDWDSSWLHALTWKFWVITWVGCLSDKDKYLQKTMALSMSGLREGLIFFSQVLRSLSCALPPGNVYHTSHHGIGAIKGVIHKQRYKSSMVVWDHGLLLRERMAAFCEDDCLLDPFTKNSILSLSETVAKLVYIHADMICPCTSCDMYKLWILRIAGAGVGSNLESRIKPISNGAEPLDGKLQHKKIDAFFDNHELNQDGAVEDPEHVHVCMLSHVLPIKDLQNAVRAADYIVNTRGLTCYRLHCFGALDKDPKYAAKCQNLVKTLKLEKNVRFHGPGPKLAVLPKTDLFINSSASEGLPCALLEASMAKVPVCCTDVGGSRQIITDPRCLAPPQDPVSLGFAQISVLTGFKKLQRGDDLNQIVLSTDAKTKRSRLGEQQYELALSNHIEEEVFQKHVALMRVEALRAHRELDDYEQYAHDFKQKEQHPWAFPLEDGDEEGVLPVMNRSSILSRRSMLSMTESVAKIVTRNLLDRPRRDGQTEGRQQRSSTISEFMHSLHLEEGLSDSDDEQYDPSGKERSLGKKGPTKGVSKTILHSDTLAITHQQDIV